MATYAIGDVQGCFRQLTALLAKIAFDPAHDCLWFVGDLVNRGPDSLAVLRFVKELGESAVTVLGNHDLHLVCAAEGCARLRRGDTLDEVLAAPDRGELLKWLRCRPLLHCGQGVTMVHAGLLPSWTIGQAAILACEVEEALRATNYRAFLMELYGDWPQSWRDDLTGMARLRVATNALTRMRVCTPSGVMDLSYKGVATEVPTGYLPWYDVPNRESRGHPIVFGHWSALGLMLKKDLLGLDTGCVWGGALSAVHLEDRRLSQISCRELTSAESHTD